MGVEDIKLIAKKILVGALVTVVPLLIFLGGLRLTEQILGTVVSAASRNPPR